MSDTNQAATEYLVGYCADARTLNYAVLLNGPWGAGKTHFVNQFLRTYEIKHLYISLYGMTSTRQIEEEFWRQLHPVLSSKPMKILTAVGKGLLKASIKFDVDGDGKEDGSVSPTLPELDVAKLANPTGRVLIFDDLERCRMPLDEVLGYINSLVEHSDFKVILIANEKELVEKKDQRYPEIKEKLIGQTLEVRACVNEALDEFIASIADEAANKYLSENKAAIIQIYEQSDSGNLRVLKHALWDFERFAAGFPSYVWKNKEAASWLFGASLSLAIEYRLGRATSAEIIDLFENKMVREVSKYQRKKSDAEPASRVQALEDRYPTLSFDQTVFDGRVLADGLKNGWFDPNATEKGLSTSSLFVQPSELPAWRTVWSIFNVSDDEFNSAVAKMEKQFVAREFLEPGEILHVTGLRLFLSEAEVLALTRASVVSECKAYIDDLERTKALPRDYDEYFEGLPPSYGFGFVNSDTTEFREVRDYLRDALLRSFEASLPGKADALLDELRFKPDKFITQISSTGSGNVYWNVPLLKHIDLKAFVDALLSLQPSDQRRAILALKERYDHQRLSRELISEGDWLKQLSAELERCSNEASGIARWRLKKYAEWSAAPFEGK
ncbi:P-loop NTPase fold protein [Hyphomicrobium sp.]|uniref:P-loop NTPase fold protein n=1 Tax=Hyphomicrobium sp. TaxID=82 RepID=UPI000F9F274C|nr:P-loop NTPase fold protein [Hyphomicrobium sp.]RUP10302.1 MAG: hypothetical protein EKK38_07715 [Hyphomicrobium sp.]